MMSHTFVRILFCIDRMSNEWSQNNREVTTRALVSLDTFWFLLHCEIGGG